MRVSEVNSAHLNKPPTELRKKNRIKTIHSSLEIEGNTLTIEQITAIIEKKGVIGPKKDILEVKNAIAVYDYLDNLNPYKFESFCKAHGILMNGLIESAGKLRSKSVGIVKGSEVAHIAPPILTGLIYSCQLLEMTTSHEKEYLKNYREISSATASRDLNFAVENGIIEKIGDKNTTRYKYK